MADALLPAVREWAPTGLVLLDPGDWRVRAALLKAARALSLPLRLRTDRRFICSLSDFAVHAALRKQLRMEFFYREMRRKTGILMQGGTPVGGKWNFDADNRQSFGQGGPEAAPAPRRFSPDAVTREVLRLVERRFANHPGSLAEFAWPVTPRQAEEALRDFIAHRLGRFGDTQDAMWTGRPWLFHSKLSSSLNLNLLDPYRVICQAEAAWREQRAPLNAVEGFVRQILGVARVRSRGSTGGSCRATRR